ncbi:MAG: response regulator transcription factor [Oscillospiraceae bacterium]|nr:response regulator transcription factor [Oscillospiraceae bacterium]
MIYLLEDDQNIRDFTIYAIESAGCEIRGFSLPSAFRAAVEEQTPDVVLLDIMLPEENGFSVLRWLRDNPATKKLPIMMLSARSTEYDKVLGLDSGADDYLAKPFGVMELLSRIRALLRRTASQEAEDETLCCGSILLSTARHFVSVREEEVVLTGKEFDLLAMLMRNQGIVLSRERILQTVWGYDYTGESRTVDVHIRTLRAKLGEAGNAVETVRGVGYRFQANPTDSTEATE